MIDFLHYDIIHVKKFRPGVNNVIGDKIKKRREELGISQEELAKRMGYKSRSSINKIELNLSDVPQKKIIDFAKALDTTISYLMDEHTSKNKGVNIPVLGRVIAGIPIEAVEEIIDYEEITESLAKTGEFFALQIKGDSMEPEMREGDIAIVRKQETAETGDIAIVLVNGDDATVKKVRILDEGIMLIPFNAKYTPWAYTAEECESLPVRIIGKVIECRRKY